MPSILFDIPSQLGSVERLSKELLKNAQALLDFPMPSLRSVKEDLAVLSAELLLHEMPQSSQGRAIDFPEISPIWLQSFIRPFHKGGANA